MTCIIQLKQRRDGFTLMRTDKSGGVASHLSCENQECWEILSLLLSLSPLYPLHVLSTFHLSLY